MAKRHLKNQVEQLGWFQEKSHAYGGDLMKKRRGRALGGRSLSTKRSMHLTLRSTKAKGKWSLKAGHNEAKIEAIFRKFASKYAIKVYSLGNAGNHLHSHIKITKRHLYAPFIRAVTAAIAMAVTGMHWRKKADVSPGGKLNFWDRRPFTSIVSAFKYFENLQFYVRINQLEGSGAGRKEARFIVKLEAFQKQWTKQVA